MPYALELALDDEAAAIVRAVWGDLAAAGFTFPAESGANPHVSLAIWDEIERAAMEAAMAAFATDAAAVEIVFPRVDVFTATGVVFLAPEVDRLLLEIHAACHRRLATFGRGAWPHYAPGVWTPHCTLAQDVGAALDRALTIARRTPLPLHSRLKRAELVEFRPVHRLAFAPLAGTTPAR